MNELKNISNLVLKILKEDTEARKDDMRLFLKVHEEVMPGISDKGERYILDLIKYKKLPSWESMRRTRQKIQEKHPELKDVETVYHRAEEEEKYLEFVRC